MILVHLGLLDVELEKRAVQQCIALTSDTIEVWKPLERIIRSSIVRRLWARGESKQKIRVSLPPIFEALYRCVYRIWISNRATRNSDTVWWAAWRAKWR